MIESRRNDFERKVILLLLLVLLVGIGNLVVFITYPTLYPKYEELNTSIQYLFRDHLQKGETYVATTDVYVDFVDWDGQSIGNCISYRIDQGTKLTYLGDDTAHTFYFAPLPGHEECEGQKVGAVAYNFRPEDNVPFRKPGEARKLFAQHADATATMKAILSPEVSATPAP